MLHQKTMQCTIRPDRVRSQGPEPTPNLLPTSAAVPTNCAGQAPRPVHPVYPAAVKREYIGF